MKKKPEKELTENEMVRLIAYTEAKVICKSLLNGHERKAIAEVVVDFMKKRRDKKC